MRVTIMTEQSNTDDRNFFFWLGADGDAEAVSKEEFSRRQKEIRERNRSWKDVDVVTGEGVGG